MPIDTSMYNQRPLDAAGAYEKGLSIRDMADARVQRQKALQEQEQLKAAYQSGVVTNADGSTTVDPQRTLSALAKVNPQVALAEKQKFDQIQAQNQKTAMEKKLNDMDMMSRALSGVKDPASWDMAKSNLAQNGVDMGQYKDAPYDPNIVKNLLGMSISAKDQWERDYKQKGFDQKERELNLKHQELGIKRQEVNGKEIDRLAQNFKKDLDPDVSRAGNFGQISAKYQAGERMKTLVGSFKDKNLPAAQVEELALGLANMVSGASGAARAQVEALVPHSAMGDAQKFKSWLMNEPYGANQQKFVEMMDHTIDREMETAQDQLNGIRAKRLSAHSRFQKLAPQQYNQMLTDYGIDPKYVKNGKYEKPAPPNSYHDMSDEELDRAYKAAGGK